MPFGSVYSLLFALFSVGAIGVAAVIGRPAERWGAAIFGLSVALTWAAQGFTAHAPLYAFLGIDLMTAVAFGVLAVKAPEQLWPGIAAVGQTLLVAFSATRAIEFPLSQLGYLVALNISSAIVTFSLASGTWVAWRERRALVAIPTRG